MSVEQTLSSHSNHEYTQITVAREEEDARARSHQQLKIYAEGQEVTLRRGWDGDITCAHQHKSTSHFTGG